MKIARAQPKALRQAPEPTWSLPEARSRSITHFGRLAIACGLIVCSLVACADGAGGAIGNVPSSQGSTAAAGRDPAPGEAGAAAEGHRAVALVAVPEPASTLGAVVDAVPVGLIPTPIPPARPRKRMNIDQLDAALRRASGDIGWTAGNGTDGKNELVTLALTLGKPNYTDVTTEDLEASALFQKFLADAAASVCDKRVSADLAAPAKARLLLVDVDPKLGYEAQPAAVDKALLRAVLRFHGRVLTASDPELESWRFLFQGATKISGKPAEAWRAVCSALIQHPAFSTY